MKNPNTPCPGTVIGLKGNETGRSETEPSSRVEARTPNGRASMVSFDDPIAPRTVAPPPLGRHPLSMQSAEPGAQPRQHLARNAAQSVEPTSFLAWLGLLTQARPLLVACSASVGAALLTVLLLAASRFTVPRRAPPTAQHAPVVAAELKSLCPATTTPPPASASSPASAPTLAPLPRAPTAAPKARVPVRIAASTQAAPSSHADTRSLESPRRKAIY